MARKSFTNIRYAWAALMFIVLNTAQTHAQAVPDVPSSVSFGGITVKFDRSAQSIIEEDMKSLMGNRKFWEEKMDRAILHFPIVEGILMDEEVPIDFKYLAVQESSFRPDVISTSNAVGYWQMKPETARELNLRVDNDIDERKNISSSTHAAAWYLKKNNQQFNNWVTTLYSYYQGAGGVKKVIPASWAYAREVTLNGKTDRYVLRFFAHKIALESGIERYKTPNAFVLMESDYGKGKSLDDIGKDLGVSPVELKNYNRWLNQNKVPSDREYLITIPVPINQVASVREKLSLPPAQTAVASVYEDTGFPVLKKSTRKPSDPNGPALYDINGLPGVEARAGDKPKTLAKAGDMSAPKFMRYNDMVADMPLVPGKVYYLARKNKKAATPFHTARPGDTWHTVSQQYGVRLVNLLKYNRTTSRNYPIQTGQVLFLTKKRPKKQPIEIIAPPQPVPAKTSPTIAEATAADPATTSSSAPAASGNDIPANAAGRKKYTPVLVEKSDGTIKTGAVVPAVPAATPAAVSTSASTAASKPAAETNDRVVIITQDNADASFKTGEEDAKKETRPNTPTKVITPNDTRTTANMSVYQRQRAAAAEKAAREAENNATIPASSTPAAAASTAAKAAYHTVRSGETFFSIANKYNLSLSELLSINGKDSRSRLVAGQKLVVSKEGGEAAEPIRETIAPERVAVTRPTPENTFKTPQEKREEIRSAVAETGDEYHTVQGGQTYYSVARQYGLSLRELMDLNNLTDADKLKSGQRLRIRKSADNAAPAASQANAGTQTHTVAAGETLFRIAQTYGTNVADIKRLNNMSGNSVMVGQKLKIPQQ